MKELDLLFRLWRLGFCASSCCFSCQSLNPALPSTRTRSASWTGEFLPPVSLLSYGWGRRSSIRVTGYTVQLTASLLQRITPCSKLFSFFPEFWLFNLFTELNRLVPILVSFTGNLIVVNSFIPEKDDETVKLFRPGSSFHCAID